MRLFMATLATETNTLVGLPTGLADFEGCQLVRGGIARAPDGLWTTPAKVWRRQADKHGWHVLDSLHAFAEPGGPVARPTYESLRDEILADLRASLPIDIVLLALHGAMVADGYDDCEGDLLARVRALAGPDATIGVLLDLHAHLTPAMTDNATAIVAYKEYPHTDYAARAKDVFLLVEGAAMGRTQPVMASFDCRTLGLFPTTRTTAMRGFVEAMQAAEGRDGILSLSLLHGFPWADLPFTGARMLAVADADPARAQAAAERFGRRFIEIRAEAALRFEPMAHGLERAARATRFPVLLADTADQVGGGAPGDSTHLLRAMLEHGLRDAAFGPLWDPLAVHYAHAAGEGARLDLRVGGKASAFSGQPLDLAVTVRRLARAAHQDGLRGEAVPIGDVAVVGAEGTDILLTSERANVFTPSLFTRHGIDLAGKRVIGVKALYRYWDAFAPLCAEMHLLATPGACDPNWASLPFRRLPRPIWPLDPDTA